MSHNHNGREADHGRSYPRTGGRSRQAAAELDLRWLKVTLQMDTLRCTTPNMVEKELWAHLLAYNAVRLLMAQAAATHGRHLTRLSFSGSLQLLRAFHAAGLLADRHTPLLRAIA